MLSEIETSAASSRPSSCTLAEIRDPRVLERLTTRADLISEGAAVTGAVTHAEGHLQGDMQYMQGAPCAAVAVLSAHPSTAMTTTTSSWQGPNKDEGGALL